MWFRRIKMECQKSFSDFVVVKYKMVVSLLWTELDTTITLVLWNAQISN